MGYSISHERLSVVIGRIYEAAYDQSIWLDVILQLQAMFHGSRACFSGMDWANVEDSFCVSPSRDPYWDRIFLDHFATNELFAPRVAAPLGRVFSDTQLIGRHRIERTSVWNEWMMPQDMYDGMFCNLRASEKNYWFFDVQRGRGQPAFDADDRAMLALITPHLQRAAGLGRHFEARPVLQSLLGHLPFAGFIVDPRLRILDMNDAAQRLLVQPITLLTANGGHLATSDSTQTQMLQRAVARVCRVDESEFPISAADLILRSERGDQLVLSIGLLPDGEMFGLSAGPCAVVLARESRLALSTSLADQLRKTFGLTGKEASVALALASGLSLKEIAIRENMAYGTARVHLDKIFRKTDTQRQSQLIALLNAFRLLP
ncbi:helix-turn-helix transcriptional regulator [Mesorhizobium ciceri]|uniref:Regulatory protein LuxR n=1 Tax=Mesorhizobium ciceri biovar biserrulae (strain HAMBI 2942 / LMG 23838 / WSM1271) TaxID=765698 RepID=E8T8S5_MESCW|nr:helix-turn-helix transcriptional regulator [Mesorhizobium ciceri]ADV12973.1 regulatory protein LuxR [Mesorhizobium ciceri biovar biserrulae WSM1271]